MDNLDLKTLAVIIAVFLVPFGYAHPTALPYVLAWLGVSSIMIKLFWITTEQEEEESL